MGGVGSFVVFQTTVGIFIDSVDVGFGSGFVATLVVVVVVVIVHIIFL